MPRVTEIASCCGGIQTLQGLLFLLQRGLGSGESKAPDSSFSCCHKGSGCPGPSSTSSPTSVPSEMARNRVSSPRWTPKDPLLVLRLGLCLFYMQQMNRDIGGSHFNPLIPCVDGKKRRINSRSVSFLQGCQSGTLCPFLVSLEHPVSRKSLPQGAMALPLGTRVLL